MNIQQTLKKNQILPDTRNPSILSQRNFSQVRSPSILKSPDPRSLYHIRQPQQVLFFFLIDFNNRSYNSSTHNQQPVAYVQSNNLVPKQVQTNQTLSTDNHSDLRSSPIRHIQQYQNVQTTGFPGNKTVFGLSIKKNSQSIYQSPVREYSSSQKPQNKSQSKEKITPIQSKSFIQPPIKQKQTPLSFKKQNENGSARECYTHNKFNSFVQLGFTNVQDQIQKSNQENKQITAENEKPLHSRSSASSTITKLEALLNLGDNSLLQSKLIQQGNNIFSKKNSTKFETQNHENNQFQIDLVTTRKSSDEFRNQTIKIEKPKAFRIDSENNLKIDNKSLNQNYYISEKIKESVNDSFNPKQLKIFFKNNMSEDKGVQTSFCQDQDIPQPEKKIPHMISISREETDLQSTDRGQRSLKKFFNQNLNSTTNYESDRLEILILNKDKSNCIVSPVIFETITRDKTKLIEDLQQLFSSQKENSAPKYQLESQNYEKPFLKQYIKMQNLELSIQKQRGSPVQQKPIEGDSLTSMFSLQQQIQPRSNLSTFSMLSSNQQQANEFKEAFHQIESEIKLKDALMKIELPKQETIPANNQVQKTVKQSKSNKKNLNGTSPLLKSNKVNQNISPIKQVGVAKPKSQILKNNKKFQKKEISPRKQKKQRSPVNTKQQQLQKQKEHKRSETLNIKNLKLQDNFFMSKSDSIFDEKSQFE